MFSPLFSLNTQSINAIADEVQAYPAGYVEINRVKLFYKITGEGSSLLYLHGGLSSSKDFDKYIPEFCKRFKVITIDRRGHGRSFDNNEPFSYSSMADDMNLFLEYLKLDSVFVIGWSDGGDVGYHLASKYPSKVRKLVAVGANYLVSGLTESGLDWTKHQLTVEGLAKSYPQVEKEYKSLNPNPENFPSFVRRTRDLWLRDPYIAKEDFMKITQPVLLMAGDKDDIRLDHMLEMHALLKNSQLCILPNADHFIFDTYSDTVADILIEFLNR